MNEIHFIQFMHPGVEHRPDESGFKHWNRGPHRRKFLEQPGKFLSGLDSSEPHEGGLHFWAEWEPESELVMELPGQDAGYPRFLFRPVFSRRSRFTGLASTDPFVFGDTFYYCVCQQVGKMKRLAAGSVILFGSCKRDRFIVDTVFVVRDWYDYDAENWRDQPVPETYRDASLAPMFAGSSKCRSATANGDRARRLYRGASYEDGSSDSPFCFFPCLPSDDSLGFARPTIRIPNVITDNLKQGRKIGPPRTAEEVRELWRSVVTQVIDQGLCLGIYAEMPPIVPGTTSGAKGNRPKGQRC